MQSGIYIPGDGKALVKMIGANNKYLVAASQHKDALKVFTLRNSISIIKVNPDDAYAIIHYTNGKMQKQEFYYGSSFLSQSSRFITANSNIKSIDVVNSKGEKRTINSGK